MTGYTVRRRRMGVPWRRSDVVRRRRNYLWDTTQRARDALTTRACSTKIDLGDADRPEPDGARLAAFAFTGDDAMALYGDWRRMPPVNCLRHTGAEANTPPSFQVLRQCLVSEGQYAQGF